MSSRTPRPRCCSEVGLSSRLRERAVRVGTVALLVGVAVLLVLVPVTFGREAWARWRVDTPVSGVLQGAGDCARSATFTDPAGRTHVVDLTPWRGQCTRGEPGDRVTVWYDASEPDVTARNDDWWWPALFGSWPVLLLAYLVGVRLHRRQRHSPADAARR